jgi:hypothetical protein
VRNGTGAAERRLFHSDALTFRQVEISQFPEIDTKESMNNLDYYKEAFNSVGWFIPPYVAMGFLGPLAKKIHDNGGAFDQRELQYFLSFIYSPENLAAMVSERYPITPYVQDYKGIISEAVAAHFLSLDHVAAAGLIPAIEGIGRRLAASRSVSVEGIRSVFVNLANDCKSDAIANNLGAVGEVVSMMDSFIEFTVKHLYINSDDYLLDDRTNRHGILHGAYSDEDYGLPINFYKSIASVDFLCFVSAFKASISWFAPEPTASSKLLSGYYRACMNTGRDRPGRA